VNAIAVNGLNLSLGGLPILKDISFTIDEGLTVALLGANGSGKSTLVRALLGLIRRQQGTVALLGQPIERFTAWDQIGYVPQRAAVSLHSTTVAEVVGSGTLAKRPLGWFGAAQRERVHQALSAVGLADSAKELYLHLSGGQQQRVLIARGIVNQPRLIIMDEPFAGVDLANQAEITDVLAGFSATTLVVLHEIEAMAGLIDRTLVLREGRLVYDGPLMESAPPSAHQTHTSDHHTLDHHTPNHPQLLTELETQWTS